MTACNWILQLILFKKKNTYLLLKSICFILGSWKLHFNRLSKSDFFSWKYSQFSIFLELLFLPRKLVIYFFSQHNTKAAQRRKPNHRKLKIFIKVNKVPLFIHSLWSTWQQFPCIWGTTSRIGGHHDDAKSWYRRLK